MSKGGSTALKGVVSAAIFIIMEIAALSMLKSSSELQDVRLNRFSRGVVNKLWQHGDRVRYYFSLVKANEDLAEENWMLREELEVLKAAREAETETAEAALKSNDKFRRIPATVTKISTNTAHNYIILNKGSEEGVKPNNGIITRHGVVGIVCAVDKHYCYGLTLMNHKISVSARAGRQGPVAPVIWDGMHSDKGIMKGLQLHNQVAPGDTIFTSGFSLIFPAGIPIGIAGRSHLADGVGMNTEVVLFQDFKSLHYVTIVENPDRTAIRGLENKEEEELR